MGNVRHTLTRNTHQPYKKYEQDTTSTVARLYTHLVCYIFFVACLFVGNNIAYASLTTEQLAISADPYQKWQGWQSAGDATIKTPELRDGKIYNLTPAQIIYYSAKENNINPLLLLIKLQAEQSLLVQQYKQPEAARRLERAVGYGHLESNPSESKWPGFYPQLVGMSYEFYLMRNKKSFRQAFLEYTPHEDKYEEFVNFYADYSKVMNGIANKTYSTKPIGWGYVNDFQDISSSDIQNFLNKFNGILKNETLFPKDTDELPSFGAKITALPLVPIQINQGDTISYQVKTDKVASAVKMIFTNPDAETALSSTDGKSWNFKKIINTSNNRTWLLRVFTDGKISDERFGGNINVVGSAYTSLAEWQIANIDYANKDYLKYSKTPKEYIYGNYCGTYTYCYAWSRHAPGSPIPDGLGHAYDAFLKLAANKKAVKDNDFSHAPIGAIVFYKTGKYGHAAIKVDEKNIISQGQLGDYDCTISKVNWKFIKGYSGYYAPAPGTTLLFDSNMLPKEKQVSRGKFLENISTVLEKIMPELPDAPLEKAALMGLISDPKNFNAADPILRQDSARILARVITYFEKQGWAFTKTGDSNHFSKDLDIINDSSLYPVVVKMAELQLFSGELTESGYYKFYGNRQLSKDESVIVIDKRLFNILNSHSKADSDNDGLPDWWETKYNATEPTLDNDQDGLNNLDEYKAGTDPTKADTDGDGYTDKQEVNAGSDPLDKTKFPTLTAPVNLKAIPADGKVTLSWDAVTGAVGYGICRATVSITDVGNCASYAGGAWTGATNTQTELSGLVNGTKYYFRVVALDTKGNKSPASAEITAMPTKPVGATGKLNDTGITTCSDRSTNGLPCPVAGLPMQDAEFGRDVNQVTNNDTDGHAGFSFTKISSTGAELPASATEWSCVKDNVTGLMWEVKTDDDWLHDKDWSYSWYEPDGTKNGGSAGYTNDGSCGGTSQCNTLAYVQAVNVRGWCGAKDWRMPSKEELRSIVSYDRLDPAIDTAYFPNTPSSYFWSASPASYAYAWGVGFYNGNGGEAIKFKAFQVRLVRSGQ